MLATLWTRAFAALTALVLLFYTPSPVVSVNPAQPVTPAVTREFTVMSYNLKVSGVGKYAPAARVPLLAENIRAWQPDSFGAQECSEFLYQALRDALPEYAAVGLGRDKNNTGEASPVFYLKDKFDLADSGTFWLSETPETVSKGWDARYNRVCTYAVLREKATGFTYVHFNAHFDHIGVAARLESVTLISQKAAALCAALPFVFTGDLNDEEGSVMYQRILDSGMRDCKHLAADTMDAGTYHGYSALTEQMRTKPIDFCFVNDLCTAAAKYAVDLTKYEGIYPSDHHPLIVTLTLGNP